MHAYLDLVSRGHTLSSDQAMAAMEEICCPQVDQTQLAAFLSILHTRGETEDELFGFITYLRNQMKTIHCDLSRTIDMCGTGGDHCNTFNISTAASLLLAHHGVPVAKHGGRSVSSQCGSADVLEALGIPTTLTPAEAEKMLAEKHFAFLYAPDYNPAFQQIKQIRKILGIRTCFNLMGPMLNPAGVKRQVMGVYSKHLLNIVPRILQRLGSEEVMVIHAQDGMDEFSLNAPTDIAHLKSDEIQYYTVHPEELGFTRTPLSAIKGGDAKTNAEIINRVLSGEKSPYRDSVLFNAAAGVIVAGRAGTLTEGIKFLNEQHFLKKMRVITEARVEYNNRKPHSFLDIFQTDHPTIIAEIKFASPSQGKIHHSHDPVTIASQYLAQGAKALSILTEPTYFHGSFDYLQSVRRAHPDARLLMKDFVLSEHQLLQARMIGADAVLLIVAFLSQQELHHLYHFAIHLGLTPLIEVHTKAELKIAESLDAKLIGINNRDLASLKVDLNTSADIMQHARTNATFISESGIKTASDMLKLQQLGFKGFLIGSHFMKHDNPGDSLQQLLSEVTNAY